MMRCLLVGGVVVGLAANAVAQGGPQRAVLVTGASSGIGRKVTERLAANGFFVYAGARAQKDIDDLNAITNVQAVKLDVTSPTDIAAAVATVTKAGKGLYGVVNNAGVVVVAPLIVESKGRVVNISSLNGIVASPMLGPYSMSKHAIEAYGDGLAAELGRLGVRVSLIEPGNYGTEIGKNLLARMDTSVVKGSRFEAQMRSAINTMRGFENNPPPDEVADAVLDALTSANPKPRYMPVPQAGQGAIALRTLMNEIVQLNATQKFTLDRDGRVKMLDDAIARSTPKP